MYEESKLRAAIYVYESKCKYMKIVRNREFDKEFRSLFREACTMMEKVGRKSEFRDGQIWLENIVLRGG